MKPFGVYVHWPYCARICPYCDFNVYRARNRDPAPLLDAIIRDIEGHRARLGARQTASVFLGGGTPSLLTGQEIASLLAALDRAFPFAPNVEITLEANPEDRNRFADHVAAGVNRISLGVQALNDADLKALGRAHDSASAVAAVRQAASTGARVSVDLIYARHGQSRTAWEDELAQALALPVEHLSLYQLTIEAGTAFERAVRRGTLKPPPNELAATLFEDTQAQCEAAGFPAYEISNHARTVAAQSQHNLVYWRSGEWAGVGPGAHGRVEQAGARMATTAFRAPQDYMDAVAHAGVGWETATTLTMREAGEEALMMGLRLAEGVLLAPIEAQLGAALKTQELETEGLLRRERGRLIATARGRVLTDRIAAVLLA